MPARPRSRETPAEARARRAAVDDPALVLDALARLLEVRSRSIAEVSKRLTEAGYRAELVQGAVERFVALGYLDDAAFARAWVESRDRAHPRGARALRDELRRRGLAADVVEAALAAREAASEGVAPDDGAAALDVGRVTSATSDREAAARLLARRQGALMREADLRRRRSKAYGLLARNGFDPDVCREAVSSWVASTGPGTAEPE